MSAPLGWPARQPRAALIVAALVTIAAFAIAWLRLKPETSLEAMLDRSDPAVVAMGQVLRNYPVVNELLLLVSLPDSSPGSSPDDSAALLRFAERFQQAAASDADAQQFITRVRFRPEADWRTFIQKVVVPNGLYYLDDQQFAAAMNRLTPAGIERQVSRNAELLRQPGPAAGALAKNLAKDPLRLYEFLLARLAGLSIPGGGVMSGSMTGSSNDSALFAPDHRSLLIRISGSQSASDYLFAQKMVDAVQRLADAQNHDGLRIDIAGAYAMAAHSARKIQSDSTEDFATTAIGLAALFVLASRRPVRLFSASFVPVAAGLIWGFAAYAIVQHTITPLAAIVGGTLGAIGFDYTIHFTTYFESTERGGGDSKSAAQRIVSDLFFPSLAAWFTSVIGFAAVVISPVRVLRDFAILGTFCLIGAWLATLLVLPPMLALFPPRGKSVFAIRFNLAAVIGRVIARYRRALLIISCAAVATVSLALAITGIHYEVESDPMVLHPQPSAPLEAQRRIAQRMKLAGGALIVHISARSADDLLTTAHAVQRRLDSQAVRQAGVVSSFGLASLLPDPGAAAARRAAIDPGLANRAVNDLKSALTAAGFRADAFAGYFLFLERFLSPQPPPGLNALLDHPDLAQYVLPREAMAQRGQPTDAVTLLFTNTLLETRDEREAALGAVRGVLSDLPGVVVTGTAAIGHDLETSLRRDLPRFVLLALAAIVLYLLIHFRSIKLTAMAMLPISISLFCVVAFIAFTHAKLNVLDAVVAPLLLGINLDYGIFAVYAWQRAKNETELLELFPVSFAALLMCGGSTMIGFGSLVLTSIPAVRSIGWLINIGLFTCIAATACLLWPAMLIRKQREAPAAPRHT